MEDVMKKRSILASILENIKLQDAGEKMKSTTECCLSTSSDKKIMYPTLYLNVEQVPSLSGYDTDDEIVLVARGKIMSHSINNNVDSRRESFDIELKEIGCADMDEEINKGDNID